MMTRRALLGFAGAVVAWLGLPQAKLAQSVLPCPNPSNCAQVTVQGGSGKGGDTVPVKLTFTQGPNDGQAGGPDEIAALALTLRIAPNGTGTPLTLGDCSFACVGGSNAGTACTMDSQCTDGGYCNVSAVKPNISNFKVVVENVSCANRTHCLCPDAGHTPDNFINIVVYGPNPLPVPGPDPIVIPVLPSGPPPFVEIDLKIAADATSNVPLHLYNQVQEASHPQFTAFLSVGDKTAVDQTCVPVPGSPPCSSAGAVSQVAFTDGTVEVAPACVGDCDGSGDVSISELLTMVNIALGNAPVGDCSAGDPDGSGDITIDEILTAVNNALTSCPQQ